MKHPDTLDLNTLGGQITWRRQRAGVSLNKLAREAGLSQGYLSAIENGKAPRPGVHIVQRLARTLRCTIEALVGAPPAGVPAPSDGADYASWSPLWNDTMTARDLPEFDCLRRSREQWAIDCGKQTERAMLAEAEMARLRAQLRIAVDGLGMIADRGGEDWQAADRVLTRIREVE